MIDTAGWAWKTHTDWMLLSVVLAFVTFALIAYVVKRSNAKCAEFKQWLDSDIPEVIPPEHRKRLR